MQLTSPAFDEGGRVPVRYTADGIDHSLPLGWTGAPGDTVEFALIMDDPDAPTAEPWVHWVVYHVPADTVQLPEGLRRPTGAPQSGITQGRNSWSEDNLGYHGPAPPPGHGVHRYQVRLYALDARLDLGPGADKNALLDAMQGHVLAEAELVGTYER